VNIIALVFFDSNLTSNKGPEKSEKKFLTIFLILDTKWLVW